MVEAATPPRGAWRISPLLAAGAVMAAAGLAVVTDRGGGPARQVLAMADLAALGLIAATDARTRIAPNRFVYPSLALALLGAFALGPGTGLEALGGGVTAFVVLLLAALAGRGAMGFGDVKMGALCGTVVGLHGVVPMLLITFFAGGVLAAVVLAFRIRRRQDAIAFTPFLVAGVVVSLATFDLYLVT